MVIIVRAHFLHQSVIRAVKGNVDADDFKGLGTDPGYVALGLLLVASFGRVIITQRSLLRSVDLLVFDAAVKYFRIFGINRGLLRQVKLDRLRGRHEAHGYVSLASRIVAEVDTERTVAMVHDFPCDQQV